MAAQKQFDRAPSRNPRYDRLHKGCLPGNSIGDVTDLAGTRSVGA